MSAVWSRKRSHTVFGYVRDASHAYKTCTLLPVNDIAVITSTYYSTNLVPRFYRQKCGNNVEFINDVTIQSNKDGTGICLLDQEISNEICDKFTLQFTFQSYGSWQQFTGPPLFSVFGFINSTLANIIDDNIDHWNQLPNRNAVTVTAVPDCQSFIIISDKLNNADSPESKNVHLAIGDKFIFIFDFIKKVFRFYLNDKELYSNTLSCSTIVGYAAVTLKDHKIEITDYQFE